MGSVRFSASKRNTIILLFVLFLVVGGSGGYLLWRVNQQKTVAPTDSEASTTCPGCSLPCTIDFARGIQCCTGSDCYTTVFCVHPFNALCNTNKCTCAPDCEDRDWESRTCTPPPCPPGYEETTDKSGLGSHWNYVCQPSAVNPGGSPENREKCYTECTLRCDACDNPSHKIRYCKKKGPNTCDEAGAVANITLSTTTPGYCSPVDYSYVAGDTDGVGEVTVTLDGTPITPTKTPNGTKMTISGTIPGDKNCNTTEHTLVITWKDAKGAAGEGGKCTRSIKYTPQANKCDGGGWDTNGNPGSTTGTRTYKYCEDIKYSATGKDEHGIKSITAKLNNVVRNVTPTKTATTTTVAETLSSKSKCLAPGNYTLNISWVDGYDLGGPECTVEAKFTVLQEVQPEWSIEKTPAEVCIDENTPNPKAELSYSIKITNTGTVNGTITTIVDTLDSKVDGTTVTNISDGGKYENGKITWTLNKVFTPKESKTLTYKYVVSKDSFGEYENTVVATIAATGTKPATTIQDSSNITADCVIKELPPKEEGTVPETGIFDDSRNIVVMGAILLFIGLGWSWITESLITVRGKMLENNRSRFEKRISKR